MNKKIKEISKVDDRPFNKRGHTQSWSYKLDLGGDKCKYYGTMANAKRAAIAMNVGGKK